MRLVGPDQMSDPAVVQCCAVLCWAGLDIFLVFLVVSVEWSRVEWQSSVQRRAAGGGVVWCGGGGGCSIAVSQSVSHWGGGSLGPVSAATQSCSSQHQHTNINSPAGCSHHTVEKYFQCFRNIFPTVVVVVVRTTHCALLAWVGRHTSLGCSLHCAS